MRVLALLLAVASCTTTTKITVKGDELYRHLPTLRQTGRADVAAQTYVDGKRGDDTVESVDLDTRLVHDDGPRALIGYAEGCRGEPADEIADERDEHRAEKCYLKTYRADPFVLRETTRFDLGLAAKSTLAILAVAGYGLMSSCVWNCEDKTFRNISLVGVGITTAVAFAFAIGKASK